MVADKQWKKCVFDDRKVIIPETNTQQTMDSGKMKNKKEKNVVWTYYLCFHFFVHFCHQMPHNINLDPFDFKLFTKRQGLFHKHSMSSHCLHNINSSPSITKQDITHRIIPSFTKAISNLYLD